MGASLRTREQLHRAYMEFFEVAERKRRWNLWDDIPWDKLDRSRNTERAATAVETFCGVELYVPDYTGNGLKITRDIFGEAWFTANWGYEESKHALVFREYLVRSGLRTEEQYEDFADQIFSKVWTLPAPTRRGVNCYSSLQEVATYLIYKGERERAERENDPVLERIYFFVGRDEAAHAGFYRKALQFELEEDREGTIADLAEVLFSFRMPGVGLVPDWDARLQVDGVAITPQHFLAYGVYPLLRRLGTSRAELTRAYRKRMLSGADRLYPPPANGREAHAGAA